MQQLIKLDEPVECTGCGGQIGEQYATLVSQGHDRNNVAQYAVVHQSEACVRVVD